MAGDPGWREPRLSLLRTAAVAVGLALLGWAIILAPIFAPDHRVDLGTVGYLTGFLLALLVWGSVSKWRWPPGGR